MKMRHGSGVVLAAIAMSIGGVREAVAQAVYGQPMGQPPMMAPPMVGPPVVAPPVMAAPVVAKPPCCLSGLFAGCGSCFRKAPAYAAAPVVAPVAAPVAAPVIAPPPPVMVPMQQTSYVPETTYRTQYQSVPVTTYKPSCEIDPCTGCPVECMQPVTQYVQQAVNVPVTQYRAVTTTKYVQMQPGYAPAGTAAPAAPAAGPFTSTIQTTPQAWGAAGSDVPQQLLPGQAGTNPPALPATGYPQPTYQQPSAPQPIMPQSATIVPPAVGPAQPQPTQPPALSPAPSLKPIPELPPTNGKAEVPAGGATNGAAATQSEPGLRPVVPAQPLGTVPAPSGGGTSIGMPVLPGAGPTGATHAFPRLLEPTGHTTSWVPAADVNAPPTFVPAYPTTALPARIASR